MTDVFRTPDERFEGLPDFDFEPHYREVEGLRLAHLDEGEGPPVVFWHGEPTWSFLWRHVFPAVRDAGYRCVVPDLVGFGRSDKPTDDEWYSYDRHTALAATLLEDLDLWEATFVVHDWGGPIGLRVAVEHADRVDRLALMDTGVFTGYQPMSDAWHAFREYVAKNHDLDTGFLVRRGCATDPGDDVARAYDAPFPSADSKAAARAFPPMIPLSPDDPGAEAGQRTLAALVEDTRPMTILWGQEDGALPPATGEALATYLGQEPPRPIEGAGHFLQEDKGHEIGTLLAEWLASAAAS